MSNLYMTELIIDALINHIKDKNELQQAISLIIHHDKYLIKNLSLVNTEISEQNNFINIVVSSQKPVKYSYLVNNKEYIGYFIEIVGVNQPLHSDEILIVLMDINGITQLTNPIKAKWNDKCTISKSDLLKADRMSTNPDTLITLNKLP